MADKKEQAPEQPRTCGLRGCTGALRPPGTGLGCMNPECTNFHEKWKATKLSLSKPVDEPAKPATEPATQPIMQ